jgi:hypothetical protein
MHMRDGSSNWSLSAARYQNNEISVGDNAAMAHVFASDFAACGREQTTS